MTPSFSSTLLDDIYHSIDEARDEPKEDCITRRDNAREIKEDISSLRRAIMIEKWMENYTNYSNLSAEKVISYDQNTPRCESGKLTRTKSRAMKIYNELKKAKQPLSPGRKISSFLNSIFSSRNLRKNEAMEDWSSSLRKSKSAKDSTTCSTSRSCLSKAPLPRSKTKRSVRFGPVSVIVGDKSIIYDNDPRMPNTSSRFIKDNISSLRSYEEVESNKYEFNGLNNLEKDYNDNVDYDDKSCSSSDLFELENISTFGNGMHREELPVYGTTSLKFN